MKKWSVQSKIKLLSEVPYSGFEYCTAINFFFVIPKTILQNIFNFFNCLSGLPGNLNNFTAHLGIHELQSEQDLSMTESLNIVKFKMSVFIQFYII